MTKSRVVCDANTVDTGNTECGHEYYLECRQRRQSWYHEDSMFSVYSRIINNAFVARFE